MLSEPTYLIPLYTTRWTGTEWGPWDTSRASLAGAFRGTYQPGSLNTLRLPQWSTPEEDMNAFLDALGQNSGAPGYWAAYRVWITKLPYSGRETYSTGQGGWITGRFGDVPLSMLDPTGQLQAGGAGTHWWG